VIIPVIFTAESIIAMFEIHAFDPVLYRRQTRRSTLFIALIFLSLAMLLSTLAVHTWGTPGGDNLRLNIAGVAVGFLLSALLVRQVFWSQPWMAAAVYGWRLKRNLMRVTNVMHQVTAGVLTRDPAAMQLLRFYHLGLTQMHQLDGNSSALNQTLRDSEQHKACMLELAMDTEVSRLDPAWLAAVKQANAAK
jgi:peptidoglycan biosynthesis protein MviN/MurJ (putative lipid II flippase)